MLSTDPLSTSTSLLNDVRNGEEAAWFRLVNTYTPLIVRWCYQHGLRGADAEDVAQNVFVAVSMHVSKFHKLRLGDSFRGWLWTITRSKLIDQMRSKKKGPRMILGQDFKHVASHEIDLAEERNSIESAGDKKVLIASALEIIRRDFSEQTWTAFWQAAALGRRPSEVAQELGMTSASVCMCRARVLRRLRETLGDL